MSLSKLNGVALASIAKINGKAKGDIAKLLGVTIPASSPGFAFKTTDLEIWWDGGDADSNYYVITNGNGVTIENQATVNGFSTDFPGGNEAIGDHRIRNGSSADFTSLTINSASVPVIQLDGVNDWIISRQLQVGDNATWDGFSYPTTAGEVAYLNPWYDITQSGGGGFSVELWWRSDGSIGNSDNLIGTQNECFRFRFTSTRQLQGVGMRLGSGTWSTGWTASNDTWYQTVFTFDPDAGSNQMKIYINGTLEAQRTGTSSVPSTTWIRNTLYIGAYNGSGSEAMPMYVGLFRKYKSPLTAQEVSDNYDADKATFGLS